MPTDGNGLPINRSGDFGVSPLYGSSQASNVFANIGLYSAFGPASPGRMSLLGHDLPSDQVRGMSALAPVCCHGNGHHHRSKRATNGLMHRSKVRKIKGGNSVLCDTTGRLAKGAITTCPCRSAFQPHRRFRPNP